MSAICSFALGFVFGGMFGMLAIILVAVGGSGDAE